MMVLAGVVPAAGLSRRMGREKVLLPLGSKTALEWILDRLLMAGVEDRIVVLRSDLTEAIVLAQQSGARVAINPHPEEEMLLSIRMGIALLRPEVEAFFLWPADHPTVSGETLLALRAEAEPGRAVIPVYRGRRGHPALLGAGLVEEISRIPPGSGLRDLWHTRPEVLRELAVNDPGVVLNLDTPEDYARALRDAES